MLNLHKWLYLLVAMIVLAGCGPKYETTYTLIPPTTANGKMCVKQCQQSKNVCQRLCNSEHNTCVARAKREAKSRFQSYKRQQQAQHQPVENKFEDFYDPSGCTKRACGCKADHRACFQMCGGELVPHRKCIAFCDKA